MKRMKQWMGIMLSVMLAAGSLQIPVFAAEADAPAEVAAEAVALTEAVAPTEAAAPAVVVAEAAEEAPEQPEAAEEAPEQPEAAEEASEQEKSAAEAPEQKEAEHAESAVQEEITEEPEMETASVAAMYSGSVDIVDSGTCGDSVYWTLDSEGTLTISGKGYMNAGIGWGDNREKIYDVIIENGVTNISEPAFLRCSNLKSITIPESVTSIGSSAFSGCSSLESITIPYGVTTIKYNTFEECSSLTSIKLPESVKSIEFNAFHWCDSLESITLPESLTSIGNNAFFSCISLTSITIPGGVTSIGEDIFWGCKNLTSVTIREGVTSVSKGIFDGCNNLTNITIPDSVTSIGERAFSNCSSLTSITVPDRVTSIDEGAFIYCSGLTNITIPDSVTSIGSSAFSGCSSLTSITIPEGVTSIGPDAFKYCPNTTVTVYSGTYAEEYVKSAGVRYKVICKTHKWNKEYTVEKEPTCTEEGLESIHCSVCDEVKEGSARAIEKAAHTYGSWKTVKPATCTESGKIEKACTVCGHKVTEEISANGHTWNKDYTIDKEPTYTEEGSRSIHCSVCDAVKEGSSVSIPKLVNPLGKTTRGDMFNLANNVKVTWKEVPGAKYYKVYREGITNSAESRKDPVIVTTGLVGWDKDPGLTNGHAYRYKIVASMTGKGDSSGDSPLSYSKLMYRLKTVVIRSVKNTAPGKVTVKYDKTTSGDSYVLQYCEREDMVGAKTKVVLGASNTSYVIGGLKKGKTYYISIRVRKKVNGIDYYTTFGVAKKISVTK